MAFIADRTCLQTYELRPQICLHGPPGWRNSSELQYASSYISRIPANPNIKPCVSSSRQGERWREGVMTHLPSLAPWMVITCHKAKTQPAPTSIARAFVILAMQHA